MSEKISTEGLAIANAVEHAVKSFSSVLGTKKVTEKEDVPFTTNDLAFVCFSR
jgi:hypothetical protein